MNLACGEWAKRSPRALSLTIPVRLLTEAVPEVPAAGGRGREGALWALSLFCVGVALVSHRIDIDDAFYVNLAVAAADAARGFPSARCPR